MIFQARCGVPKLGACSKVNRELVISLGKSHRENPTGKFSLGTGKISLGHPAPSLARTYVMSLDTYVLESENVRVQNLERT